MEKNIKNIKAEFKKSGIFYTPPELAETLKQYVDFTPSSIYDPTVGQGNLLAVFPDEIKKYGQEIDSEELEKAKVRLKNFQGYVGDTLLDDGFKGIKFDLIVANPPFSIKWEPNKVLTDERWKDAPTIPSGGKADYAFLLHILYHLSDNGKAICLEFPGILYRGMREGTIRQWMIENNYIERVVHIPGNTFVDTAIATCILILNKSKTTTDIIFEDKELQEEKVVSFEEVKENGFNLSVSSYIFKEEQREKVDPVLIDLEARRGVIEFIKKQIDFEIAVCQLEGWDATPFFDEMINTISEKKRYYADLH